MSKWRRSAGDPKGRTRRKVKVKTARGRKLSSTRWLQRQLNDPYVAEAQRQGYRARAAFKLTEIDDRFQILKGCKRILDLGAAPGGWSQVAAERAPGAAILAVDLLEMEDIDGVKALALDFMQDNASALIRQHLGGSADLVMSDMAAAMTGHQQTDHLRTMALVEAAADFALIVLSPGGTFLAKVLQGGTEKVLLDRLKKNFATVRHVKPPASRAESNEIYVLAMDFRR